MSGEEDRAGSLLGSWLWGELPHWLESGQIRPLEFEVIGGLDDVPEGLKRLEEGRARTRFGSIKLVVAPV